MATIEELEAKIKALEDTALSLTEQEKKTRLQLWLSFWKFFLGSVVIGILSVVLNNQIQSTELKMKAQEQKNEYVSKFLTQAMDDNLDKRVRFAHYFAMLLEDKWTGYYKELSEESKKEQTKLNETKKKIAELDATRIVAEAQLARAHDASDMAGISQAAAQAAQAEASIKNLVEQAALLEANLNPLPQQNINGRIYLKVSSDQEATAEPILRELKSRGYAVNVRNTLSGTHNKKTTIAYYYDDDKPEAEALAKLLEQLGVEQMQTPRKVQGVARPRHFDVVIAVGS
ncbi:MAG: hypothetical protein KJ717_11415 [Proteobacteria bacterium]|nr:hypothetical protein [Pseudomonadota bacterium]